MSKKTFPLSKDELEEIIKKYPTPFHIYDEHAIRENIRKLQKAFAWAPRFREQFAVKSAVRSERHSVLVKHRCVDCIRRSALAENALDNAARRSRMIGIIGYDRADAAARVRYGIVAGIYKNDKVI